MPSNQSTRRLLGTNFLGHFDIFVACHVFRLMKLKISPHSDCCGERRQLHRHRNINGGHGHEHGCVGRAVERKWAACN